MNKLLKLLLALSALMGMSSVYATYSFNKAWYAGTIIGPFWPDSSFKYYGEQHLRFVDRSSVFNQLLLLGGLGYQLTKNLAFFAGPGWIMNKTILGGDLVHERRFWQQLNWLMQDTSKWTVNSRTRLEQRKLIGFGPMSVRFRQRIWVRLPIAEQSKYSFSCFNEIFLNLTHPIWTSPYLYEQNRAFAGISYRISKSFMIDVGYLNQYLHNVIDEVSNVALINITISQ